MSRPGSATAPAGDAVEGRGVPAGLLEKLIASVRPEFRHDVIVFAPDDPVFGGTACAVPGCRRPAGSGARGLCNGHYKRWAQAGRPDLAGFAATAAGGAWRGTALLTSCRVPGCGFGVARRHLCPRHAGAWHRAGEPDVGQWVASAQPATALPEYASCLVGPCELRAEPTSPLCWGHLRRWKSCDRPDLAGFVRACEESAGDHQRADLTSLPRQLRLEVQYALQCRSDDKMVRNRPEVIQMAIRRLSVSGTGSLLDLSEQQWRDACPYAIAALIGYAHRKVTTLAEGEGWDNEYPRDTWQLRRIGLRNPKCSVLQFGEIPQPWLKDLAKRWTRWRLSAGLGTGTCRDGVAAITRFAGFLHASGITRPGQVDRGVLERYLAELLRAMGERASRRQEIGLLSVFLRDTRRHQWESSLPADAMFFPEDYPRRPQALPRFLAEQVMTQVEDTANLDRFGNPAYRLITLILIRCGLRVTAATSIAFDCVVRDTDGAPYLRYYNQKMKREALVPIDEELEYLIQDQQRRASADRPEPPPVLFPRPFANINGQIPVASCTYRPGLYRWLEDCDIRDEHGQPVRLTPHQWRHILSA